MCLAVPGKIVSVGGDDRAFRCAEVDFSGVRRSVSVAFTPEAKPGDFILVHAGYALTILDEQEAEHTLDELRRLGESNAELEREEGLP
jgi:hydrogenase expression/formation protein HypC